MADGKNDKSILIGDFLLLLLLLFLRERCWTHEMFGSRYNTDGHSISYALVLRAVHTTRGSVYPCV